MAETFIQVQSSSTEFKKKKKRGGEKCLAKMFGTEFHAKARASGRQTSHSADPNQGRDFSTAA